MTARVIHRVDPTSPKEPINLLGLGAGQLADLVAQWGGKPFRARQLQRWIHQRGADSFDEMTDLAREFRLQLAEHCSIHAPAVSIEQRSTDGTRKWLFDVGKNNAVEAVFIPEDDRGTLCISSQAGCTVACPFCSTGYQGFNRNLTTAEIIGQLWYARRALQAEPASSRIGDAEGGSQPTRVISNVVMMGMGEPLLNYDQVVGAFQRQVQAVDAVARQVDDVALLRQPFLEVIGQLGFVFDDQDAHGGKFTIRAAIAARIPRVA